MKIFKIIASIIILLAFILIGSPIKYNCLALNVGIIIIGSIYILYKILKEKQNVINRKIDIIVLIFCLSPIIPLIFNTYSSLEETLISFIKYISIFNLYIILKDIVIKEENWITNILILGATILVILGIDEMSSKILMQYAETIGLPYVINYENRMFSTLGYANSFAIIMAITLLIAISKCKTTKEIFSGFIFLFLSGLLLSYSRSVLLLFILVFFIYIFLVKDKTKIYKLYVVIINLVLSFIYMKIFEIALSNKQYIFIWIVTIILFILSVIIAKLITKNYEKLNKIKRNTYIKLGVLSVILIGMIYFIGIHLDVPLNIFFDGEENSEVRYNIYNINPNEHYIFTFDINAKSKLNNIENYSIKIIEENKYYDTVQTHEITFNNYIGIKKIEFTASKETHSVVILFNNNIQKAQQGLTINSLYINDSKYILEYAYLPVKLVKRIENFALENKSLWERTTFFKDGLKIASQNIFTGTGGRGWLYNYEDVQSYVYASTEIHNYLIQIFVENGIISVITWITIIIYCIFRIVKRWKNKNIKIIDLAFILLTLHSLVDFDMSFYCIMVIWIILFTITIKEDHNYIEKSIKNYTNLQRLNKLISISFILLSISILILSIYTFRLKQYNAYILESLELAEIYQEDNNAIEYIKRYTTNERYKKFYDILKELDYQEISMENMEYVYESLKEQKIVVNTKYNMERNLVIKQILETNKDEVFLKKFANIIIKENEEMVDNIKNKDKNRLTENTIKEYLQLQQEIYILSLEKMK